MIGIIVAAHGQYAKELLRSTSVVFGELHNVAAVTFEPGESVSGLHQKLKEAMDTLEWSDGVLFLVDLFGGSPYNAASRIAAETENADIVSGVNLPMLVDVLVGRESEPLSRLGELAIAAGQNSMKSFRSCKTELAEEEL
ncbi:PTS system mannose-specific EIIAB component [compost metagenome]